MMRQTWLFALTSTPWCAETDNTAGLSSSRCSTCLMTTRSVFFNVLHYMSLCWFSIFCIIFCSYSLCFSIAVSILSGPCFLNNAVLFSSHAEVRRELAAVCRRQSRLLPISESGRAAVHHAPCRHHTISVRQQPAAVLQRGVLLSTTHCVELLSFYFYYIW